MNGPGKEMCSITEHCWLMISFLFNFENMHEVPDWCLFAYVLFSKPWNHVVRSMDRYLIQSGAQKQIEINWQISFRDRRTLQPNRELQIDILERRLCLAS